MSDCIFCKIANKEIPAQIVYEDESCVAFKDANPQAPTHILVVPREHLGSLLDVGEKQKELMGHICLVATKLAREARIAERGFRVVTNTNREAGQSVDHLHFHVLGGRVMGWPPG